MDCADCGVVLRYVDNDEAADLLDEPGRVYCQPCGLTRVLSQWVGRLYSRAIFGATR